MSQIDLQTFISFLPDQRGSFLAGCALLVRLVTIAAISVLGALGHLIGYEFGRVDADFRSTSSFNVPVELETLFQIAEPDIQGAQ